jgi:hypothetical protein
MGSADAVLIGWRRLQCAKAGDPIFGDSHLGAYLAAGSRCHFLLQGAAAYRQYEWPSRGPKNLARAPLYTGRADL